MTTKICTKCGIEKPSSDFYKRNDRPGGLQPKCKKCGDLIMNKYRSENRDKIRKIQAKYYASNSEKANLTNKRCREANPKKYKEMALLWLANHSDMNKASKKRWREENRDKMKECNSVWRAANPDKHRESIKKWRIANPEKLRIYTQNRRTRKMDGGGQLSHGIAEKLYKLQRGKCACCKQPLGDNYHLDHIVPLALGGLNEDSNIQLLRATCNFNKGAKDPVYFMQQRGFLL